ncbi:MAG TPA: hypothetical protein VIM65_04160 [Cyclobacteriaceae bacterium]
MRANLIVLLLTLATFQALAQRDFDEGADWSLKDRGYLGIGLGGLGFGSSNYGNYFTVGLSGQVGYMLTKDLSTGIGAEYQYTNYGSGAQSKSYSTYTGYPFVRFNIKDFFLQTDYDYYSVPAINTNERKIINRFFIGIGYSSPTQNGGRFNFLVSYDLLYPNPYVLTSPLSTRFYFTF